MVWLSIGATVAFLAALTVLLRITYSMGWSGGCAKERDRWKPKVDAIAGECVRLRAELARRKGPWEVPPPPPRLAPVAQFRRPQPNPRPRPRADTSTLTAACKTTGGMRAITDETIAAIEAGTWPPQLPGISGPDGMT